MKPRFLQECPHCRGEGVRLIVMCDDMIMMMSDASRSALDDWIAATHVRAKGRTRYEGQRPYGDEMAVNYIALLETALIKKILAEIYAPPEIELWLDSPQPMLGGQSFKDLIDAGRGADVLKAAQGLLDGGHP